MYKYCFKRVVDIVISIITLLVLLPLFLIICILIKLDSSGPVFYLQQRVGKDSRLFKIYKLRTMTNKQRNPEDRQTFSDDPDITRIGGFLRRFKVDELPQVWNVFVGDMSLIGPRPALPLFYKEYGEQANHRLAVRPGMTGLAQVNGNIYLSWKERLEYDRKYVTGLSFKMDLCILFKTIGIIFLGEEKFIKK